MNAVTLNNTRDIKIAQWFSTYGNRLVRFIRSRVDSLTEAEDIAQDVWYQLTRQDDIDKIEQIGGWLFNAAKNRVFNFYKKKKTIPFSNLNLRNDEDDDTEVTNDLSFNQWASDNLTEGWLESAEFWKKLDSVLQSLPAEQRDVFVANELNDISFKELSEISGVGLNTLLARKRYAVLKLREAFEKY